ncbi:MAG: TRAP transporter substrate-binding protein [Cognatishimia activa]
MSIFTKTLAGAAALATFAVTAQADELKLAHFSSPKYHLHNEMFLPLADKIAAATNGETTIRVYPGGELGAGPVKQYDRVIDGVADIVYGLPGYTASQFKQSLMVELPGMVVGYDTPTQAIWDNIDMLDKEFRRTKLLGLWNAQEAVLLTAEKPIRALSDLEGLKIRVPSKNTGRVIEAWGATPVSMPITQVYTSMETGVIDGVLVDPSVLHSFKLGEVTKYVTKGMNATNSLFMLVMNRDSWNDLDAETQAKLDGMTGAEMSEGGRVTMDNAATKALTDWAAAGGEVIELSAEAAAEFNAASDVLAGEVTAELEGDGVNAVAWSAALKK